MMGTVHVWNTNQVFHPMSTPSTLNESLTSNHETESPAESAGDSLFQIKPYIQFAGFWGAIVLPFVHVSILAHGLTSVELTLTFLALLICNLFALYVGHGYNQA